jgi:polynucleotide 5'-kinase involved in rRNA processing
MATDDIRFQVFQWAWEKREEILESLRRLSRWFRGAETSAEQKPGILILGPGGTGKTTLARILAGEYYQLFDSMGEL